MLHGLRVTNSKGESLDLLLHNYMETGLLVANIEGLTPVESTIAMDEQVGVDGGVIIGQRKGARNIIITLIMEGDIDVEVSRKLTYRYFQVGTMIDIEVLENDNVYKTSGMVEYNNPIIFDEQQKTSISILCPDSYFGDAFESTMLMGTILPAFEFPFPSVDGDLGEPTIEFTTLMDSTNSFSVECLGTVPTGCTIDVKFSEACSDVSIFSNERAETMTSTYPFLAGDMLRLVTYPGNLKRCRLLRNGVWTNIFNSLGRDPNWITVVPGVNTFGYTTSGNASAIDIMLYFNNLYGGI